MSEHEASARSWKKPVGWTLLILFVLVFVTHLIWARVELNRLQATLDQFAASGEPITMAQLTADSTPDADNASLTYKRAGAAVAVQSPTWQRYQNDADPSGYRFPLTDSERRDIQQIVDENKSVFALLDAARLQRAGGWHDIWTSPYLVASLNINYMPQRTLANLLRLNAELEHARGNDTACLEKLHDILRLADACEKRCSLVGHLVAVGIRAMASDALCRLAPRLGPAMDRGEAVAMIGSLLDESPVTAGIHREFQSERIMEADMYTRLINGQFQRNAALPTVNLVQVPLTMYLVRPLLASDAAGAMKTVVLIEKAAVQPDWPDARAAMPTAFKHESDAHPLQHMMSRLFLPALDRAVETNYRLFADDRLAAAALACRLYAIDHNGALPESLPALVPAYLPAVPIDPLAGGARTPLRLTSSRNHPRLYSVGPNGIDDGGSEPLETGPLAQRQAHSDTVVNLTPAERKPYVAQ